MSQQLQRTQRFTNQDSRTDFQDRSLQDLQDKVLQCVVCQTEFVFSVSSQQHHKTMGLQRLGQTQMQSF